MRLHEPPAKTTPNYRGPSYPFRAEPNTIKLQNDQVTIQVMSIAVESRAAEFVFGKFYDPLIADSMIHRPDSV